MFNLSGKAALVTGASGGIGAAIARSLHAQGAMVTLSGTRKDALGELADALGERAYVIAANLDDDAAVDALPSQAESEMGQLDILVNNAGLTRDNLALRLKDEDWDIVLRVNLRSAFKLARGALRGMMKRRWGRIISVTSIVGIAGNPGQTNYAASKAGLIGMTKSLAQEVATRGITVNTVAPGFIATSMTDALSEDQRADLLERIPGGRLGTSEDIAAGVVYLASEEASYVTGQTLHINGGMAMP